MVRFLVIRGAFWPPKKDVMYFFKKSIEKTIIEALDTETLAFVTEIKNKLNLKTYEEAITTINTCTDKYKLEQLLIKIMLLTGNRNGK